MLQLDAKMRPFKVDYYVSAKATSPMASLYYKYNAQGDEGIAVDEAYAGLLGGEEQLLAPVAVLVLGAAVAHGGQLALQVVDGREV